MNTKTKIEASSLASAYALAFGEIEAATKSAANPAFKQNGKVTKYADITAVIDAIKPALINHGLFFTQHCHPCERGVQVETHLHHASGETMPLGGLYVPANKQDAQGFGSALTYARRYALVTAFGVPTEDDDGNAAVKAGQGQSQNGAVSPAPAQQDYAFPDGPATGISQLKGMVRNLWREAAGCGDPDELLGLLETQEAKDVMQQCSNLENPTHREIWDGDGKDNPGLSNFIKTKQAELEKQRNMTMVSGGKYKEQN